MPSTTITGSTYTLVSGTDEPTGGASVADTGWRTVVSWTADGTLTGTLPAGWKPRTGQAGYVRIRRIGKDVRIAWLNLACAIASTTDRFYIAPAGFQASAAVSTLDATMVPSWSSANAYKAFGVSVLCLRAQNFGFALDDYLTASSLSYLTDDDWPNSLPGAAL